MCQLFSVCVPATQAKIHGARTVFYSPHAYFRIQLTVLSVWLIFTSQKICLYCVYEEFYSRLRQPKTLTEMTVGMKNNYYPWGFH